MTEPAPAAPILRPGFVHPTVSELNFRIMRQGSRIGHHHVRFQATGTRLAASTEVELIVKLLGITMFRLKHRFEEVWVAGRLAAATSRLDRNGEVIHYTATAAADATALRGSGGTRKLPADVAPLTWWDPSRFGTALFHVYDGRPVQPNWQHSALPHGGRRWQATGSVNGAGTYRADGTWVDWQTRGEDGSRVNYVAA